MEGPRSVFGIVTLGAGDQWLPNYRSLYDRLLPFLVALVPDCAQRLGANLNEDAITRNLVKGLIRNPEFRRIAWVEYHFEPFKSDERGNWASTGEIDMVVYPAGFWNREAYLAYECKCLNVTTNQGKRSQAGKYVVKGVLRFVSERYSRNLPLGCMLGYVLDGRVSDANMKVRKAIQSRAAEIYLDSGPDHLPALRSSMQFETTHVREISGIKIRIRHLLVSCV